MKDKSCPFCRGRAEIKPLLDPHKKTGVKDRFMMFEYSCSTKGCYLEEGAGNYVDKNNLKVLTDQWAAVPDYVKNKAAIKKPKIVKKKPSGAVHFSLSGEKVNIPCSSRANAKSWSRFYKDVNCSRCLGTKNIKDTKSNYAVLDHRNVS